MRSEEMESQLLEEFPELGEPEVIWEKEVFAHFGLLFMGIGLLEHALINAVMLTGAAREFVKEKGKTGAWPDLIDRHFESATKLTFGNLRRAVLQEDLFDGLASQLDEVKRLRDYFAHHFMRVDSDLMSHRSGCVLLIFRLHEARQKLDSVRSALDEATNAFFVRVGLPAPSSADISAHVSELKFKVEAELTQNSAEVGWRRDAL